MAKILFVTAELFPFIKTGGLADYSEALPNALSKEKDMDVRILIPGYPDILNRLEKPKKVLECKTFLSSQENIILLEGSLKGFAFPIYVIKAAQLYERKGSPYVDGSGKDWSDNFERFATLSMLPYLMIKHNTTWTPDLVHTNDWHTGLASVYLKSFLPPQDLPKTVFTIHNLAFQGNFPAGMFGQSGISQSLYGVNGVEFFGKLSFMKGGINFSDKVIAVSPRYALEVASMESFGCGFTGMLAARGKDFLGILNGVDYNLWSPSKDRYLTYHYTKDTLKDKEKQKHFFQKTMGLRTGKNKFLISSVTRLSHQKGIDMAIEALKHIIPSYPQIQYFCVGTGDGEQEKRLTELAQKHPEQVCFFAEYNESLAHQAIGSADAFLMPSRFEPCGLTQIYALKYGTIPLVTPVGGLLDTVKPYVHDSKKPTSTGIIAEDVCPNAIHLMMVNAFKLYKDKPLLWQKMMVNAMSQNFSWKKSATAYKKVYEELLS